METVMTAAADLPVEKRSTWLRCAIRDGRSSEAVGEGRTVMAYRDVVTERAALIEPPGLTGDMSGDDIAFVLRGLRFRNGLLTIALDKAARDYLVDAVLARTGGRSR
jgi:hypothetical protein